MLGRQLQQVRRAAVEGLAAAEALEVDDHLVVQLRGAVGDVQYPEILLHQLVDLLRDLLVRGLQMLQRSAEGLVFQHSIDTPIPV